MNVVISLSSMLRHIADGTLPKNCVYILNHDVGLTNNMYVNYEARYHRRAEHFETARAILKEADEQNRFYGQDLSCLKNVNEMCREAIYKITPGFFYPDLGASVGGWQWELIRLIEANPSLNLID